MKRFGRTPFDDHADRANDEGFYNHRVNTHADIISDGIMRDLYSTCRRFREDIDTLQVGYWTNQRQLWGRKRNTDALVAPPDPSAKWINKKAAPRVPYLGASHYTKPNKNDPRLLIEHKSVVTAHRNKTNRDDDLRTQAKETSTSFQVISAVTVMVGVSPSYLNVADGVKRFYKRGELDISGRVLKKWDDTNAFDREVGALLKAGRGFEVAKRFAACVSPNKYAEALESITRFGALPTRELHERRHKEGFDALLVVPVDYSNIRPAKVMRAGISNIDVDAEYSSFIERLSKAYAALFPEAVQDQATRRVPVETPKRPSRIQSDVESQ